MTLINALETLKAQGITKLTGMCDITDIDTYIEHATENHNYAVKYAAQGIQTWQHSLDHEDDSFIVETPDGHHIIATTYGTADGHTFDMATYSDYGTSKEMYAAFDAWRIDRDAESIAAKMDVQAPGLSHTFWKELAIAKLKAAYETADKAFERDFGTQKADQKRKN